jgi:Rrf2 family protein
MLIKMSEATSIALHALAYVCSSGQTVNAAELARVCRASEAHTMKVCQRLAKAGILIARRGPGGGFTLGRDPQQLRLAEIYTLFDGPLSAGHCVFATPACGDEDVHHCIFGGKMFQINQQIAEYFQETRLSDIAVHCHQALTKDAKAS